MDDIKLFENWFKSTKWFTGYNCTPKYITYRSMLQAWQASAQREGYVVVPKEPSAELVNHGHQVFLGHFNEGGQTGGRSLYFAYKSMIEAVEK